MGDYNFGQIKDRIFEWAKNYNNFIEMVKNEPEILIYDLEFKNCLAQIVVYNPFFAPYKNVSFEALAIDSKKTMENGQPELIYVFYDSDNTFMEDVIYALDYGIKYCYAYIPGKLEEIYTGKKGYLDFTGEKPKRVIYPDDLKEYKQIFNGGKLICTGVQCQYLVLKSALGTIRILPEVFK